MATWHHMLEMKKDIQDILPEKITESETLAFKRCFFKRGERIYYYPPATTHGRLARFTLKNVWAFIKLRARIAHQALSFR